MIDHAGPSAMTDADGSDGRELVIGSAEQLWQPSSRRNFLRLLGLGGTVVMLPSLFACNSDDNSVTGTGTATAVTLNLSNDTGILNYAFALEQLEAAFYTAVVASSAFSGMSAEQKEVMVDLRNHEVIHREFFRQVLGSARVGDLALNSSTVTTITANTATILKTAEMFEDLGVAAYNGAGKYLTDSANLLVAGKIVSVEARHAAAIRDLREGLSLSGTPAGTRFAGDDVVNASGLDVKLEPSGVLTRVAATNVIDMTKTSVSIGTQPTTKPGTDDQGPPSPTP
ncbi:MAG: hypothetical protein JWO05_1394 [Gemmatimonadetes bacterium]|nr:hypothetical protein [Gemmatimonadota bacterium]